MKSVTTKIIIAFFGIIAFLFFSNNFELIDIEKTAIVTALALDFEENEYAVTAQIALPEATDTNTENSKAQVKGKGSTVADAIKDIGDVSGWFPQLTFCNLIILGNSLKDTNCIRVLDYFVNTLRVQDSAVVILAEKKASELLEVSTPLDNISSFALQKILLKNPGFDNDNATNDIKTFCTGYYDYASSAIMPLVKIVDQSQGGSGSSNSSEGGGSSGGGSSGGSVSSGGGTNSGSGSGTDGKGQFIFDSRTTALFKKGVYVGELNNEQTFCLNLVTKESEQTTILLTDVNVANSDEKANYLLNALTTHSHTTLDVTPSKVVVNFNVDMYCKVVDQTTEFSDVTSSHTIPLNQNIIDGATNKVTNLIQEIFDVSVKTECDYLNILSTIYKYNHKYFDLLKDNYFNKLECRINVNVSGQK